MIFRDTIIYIRYLLEHFVKEISLATREPGIFIRAKRDDEQYSGTPTDGRRLVD